MRDWPMRDAAADTSQFYSEYATPLEISYCLGCRFDHGEDRYAFVALAGEQNGPPSDRRVMDIAATFERANAAAALSLRSGRARATGFAQGLACANIAAILLARDASIIALTPKAELLLGDRLRIEGDRLVAQDPTVARHIERLQFRLSDLRDTEPLPAFHVANGVRGLVISPLLIPYGLTDAFSRIRAVLVVRDLDEAATCNGATLRALFRLTPAEAEIATLLAHGHTVEEIAAKRGVHRESVRTMLKSVFGKTQTNRQADLVALLSRL